MKPVDEYFFRQIEPYQSIMLYVRSVILKTKPEVQEHLSYGIPFYSIKKKPMLYINVLKNTDFVDVAFVNGIKFKDDFPELKDYNTRKQVRSIQLKNIEDLDEARFISLLNLVANN